VEGSRRDPHSLSGPGNRSLPNTQARPVFKPRTGSQDSDPEDDPTRGPDMPDDPGSTCHSCQHGPCSADHSTMLVVVTGRSGTSPCWFLRRRPCFSSRQARRRPTWKSSAHQHSTRQRNAEVMERWLLTVKCRTGCVYKCTARCTRCRRTTGNMTVSRPGATRFKKV